MNDWRHRARCRGLGYALAFAEGPCAPMIETCVACPVIDQCRDDALQFPAIDQVGIRGGLYAVQRVAIIRGRRLQPASH